MVIPVAEKVQIQGNESRKANFHESFEKKLLAQFPLNGHLFEVKTPPQESYSLTGFIIYSNYFFEWAQNQWIVCVFLSDAL